MHTPKPTPRTPSLKPLASPCAGRTGRAGSSGQATSFYVDRDAFLVSQIRQAIKDLESGNSFAFATGKAARAKEREASAAFKAQSKMGFSGAAVNGEAPVKVDDKYRFMVAAPDNINAGAADDAWDD